MTPLEKPVGKPIRCRECRGTGYAEAPPGFTFGPDCPVCQGEGWLSEPAQPAGEDTDIMTDAERLARAVLLFHRGGRWTGTDRNEWVRLTGEEEATTRTLCDLARRIAFQAHD